MCEKEEMTADAYASAVIYYRYFMDQICFEIGAISQDLTDKCHRALKFVVQI